MIDVKKSFIHRYSAYKTIVGLLKKNDYDILHCVNLTAGIISRRAVRKAKSKAKLIYTAHGFKFYKKATLRNWIMYYPLENSMAKNLDAMIVLNQEDYNNAKRFKFNKKGILYLVEGTGFDETKFPRKTEESKKEAREKLGIGKDEFMVISVGELNKRKHQDLVIEAAEKIKDEVFNLKLYIIGDGPMREEYESLVDFLKIKDYIVFTGYKINIVDYLHAADVFASSAKQEGLPQSVLEAMNVEIPLVLTDCRGNKDLVSDGENGILVDVYNPETMAKAIKKIYYDAVLIKSFLLRSKKKVGSYTDRNVRQKVGEIYKKVLTKRIKK